MRLGALFLVSFPRLMVALGSLVLALGPVQAESAVSEELADERISCKADSDTVDSN